MQQDRELSPGRAAPRTSIGHCAEADGDLMAAPGLVGSPQGEGTRGHSRSRRASSPQGLACLDHFAGWTESQVHLFLQMGSWPGFPVWIQVS